MGNKSQWLRTSLLSFAELLDDSAVEQESEEELCGSRSSLERQGHRGNTTVHVCWHRNTSVSMVDFSIAVEVRSCMPSGPLLLHLLLLSSSCAVLSPVDVQFVFSVLVSHFSSHVCVYIFQFLLLFHFCPIFPLLSSCLLSYPDIAKKRTWFGHWGDKVSQQTLRSAMFLRVWIFTAFPLVTPAGVERYWKWPHWLRMKWMPDK